MCGIFAICGGENKKNVETVRNLSILQTHRGPDARGCYQNDKNGNILCHERLIIIDLQCTQPIQGSRNDVQVVHNGEIYNHEMLRKTELFDFKMKTTCDSEPIVFLWEKYNGPEFINLLDGVFAFVIVDGDRFMAARDPIGVKPLYYGVSDDKTWYFSSEMKSLIKDSTREMTTFPPGHYYTSESGFVRYYQPLWMDYRLCINSLDLTLIKTTLINATVKRLMSDVPLGVLLSGGLDSSLTSSIAMREMRKQKQTIKSFSIGLDAQAPDLISARKVASFIGTEHHEVHFTVEQGLMALDRVIWHLETYDVTSVRASTPMFLLSEYINQQNVKVVLSGEGADEIFGGYLYFHNAPNNDEFQKETIRRVSLLSTADCLRADKSCMAHGLEVRVPFLDRHFLDVAMMVKADEKIPKFERGNDVEKWMLRKAFDDQLEPFLPKEILWRQKEQFSDGVGYQWIDRMTEHCEKKVTDEQYRVMDIIETISALFPMRRAGVEFPHNTPETKEAYYIRSVFARHFPGEKAAKSVLKWEPKWQLNRDPSGRWNNKHVNSVETKEHLMNGLVVDTDQ